MVTFKVVIGTKDGKCVQKEVGEPDSKSLIGKKVGDTIKGESFGLTGYEFLITGGSDYAGFPMRKDIPGQGRKRILAITGVGMKKARKGQRQRKTVCGNTIHSNISQINLKITQEGKNPLTEPKKEEKAKPEEAKKETPKEEVKK
ncbi:30S ribosomal protein S6e [Candidatus Woesearchaeota archaeon]|nr:30S ribosomal protein S6e [Candidatus Woesearchaeota archaeon]